MKKLNGCELPKLLMDSREKSDMKFKVFDVEVKALRLGNTLYSYDYSLVGHEELIGIEYKSHGDLYQSMLQNHEHFFRKMRAMTKLVKYPVLAVGTTPQQVMIGCVVYKADKWQRARRVTTQGSPGSVLGNMLKLVEIGFRVRFCKDEREKPAQMIESLMLKYLSVMSDK